MVMNKPTVLLQNSHLNSVTMSQKQLTVMHPDGEA